MARKIARRKKAGPTPSSDGAHTGETGRLVDELAAHRETSPALSGGDVDADWQRAHDSGEEAVGGSVATPDQDVVDEIGRARGVAQEPPAEVHTSEEILRDRDRLHWHLERDAADQNEGRVRPRHRG
jgi:hypothetical protein